MSVTRSALDDPVSNSWLPFTGDLGLRAAISEHIAARHGRVYDPEREIVVTCGGTEGVLDVLLATIDPGDEVVLTDPTYAGLVNRVRLAGGVRPAAAGGGGRRWRLDRDALAASVSERTVALLLMSPSMPSGCVLSHEDWAFVARCASNATCSCSTTPRWRRCSSTAARPVAARPSRDGGADGDRRLDVEGLPDDRLARGLGRGPAGLVGDAGWVHTYNTTGNVSVARRAAEAVLRGPQEHVGGSSPSWSAGATRSSRRSPAGRSCGWRAAGRC